MTTIRRHAVFLRIGILLAAAVFLGERVKWHDVAATISHARAGLLGAVILLNAAIVTIKALRLRLMTAGRLSVSASILTKLAVAALNNLAPLRGGDVARLWMLERHAGMTRTSSLAVGVSELLVEVATLCSLVALVAGALPGQRWAFIGALIVLGPAVVLLIVLPRVRSALGDGLRPLRNPKTVGAIVLLSTAEWLIESVMIVVTAKATGLTIGFAVAMVALMGLNLAIALPSLPASAGAFEAGLAAVLMLSGVANSPAISFAIVYHLVQVIPVTVIGTIVVSRMGLTLGGLPSQSYCGELADIVGGIWSEGGKRPMGLGRARCFGGRGCLLLGRGPATRSPGCRQCGTA